MINRIFEWLYERRRARRYAKGPGNPYPKKGWYHTWNR